MDSWNVEYVGDSEVEYVLLNRSRTHIRIADHATVDIAGLMARMEEVGVPLRYTEGLREIYFTVLPGSPESYFDGDYKDGVIRISTAVERRNEIPSTLIHEIGHHVEELNDLKFRKKILEEKPKAARLMPDPYARRDVSEYIACGFEVYYMGTRQQRGAFRRNNPRLYNVIRYMHRKHTQHDK